MRDERDEEKDGGPTRGSGVMPGQLLVLVDDTPECEIALRFAARRASRTGSGLLLLYVIPVSDFQYWLNVEKRLREEKMQVAEEALARFADMARLEAGVEAELCIREGSCLGELVSFVRSNEAIVNLILASAYPGEGSNPVISSLVEKIAGQFPIPVTLIPSSLADERMGILA